MQIHLIVNKNKIIKQKSFKSSIQDSIFQMN